MSLQLQEDIFQNFVIYIRIESLLTKGSKYMNDVEEISLYELIMMISKGWKTILITTVITIGLSIGVYVFNNQPSYESQTTGLIVFNQNQFTDIGLYSFPYSKSEDIALMLKDKEFTQLLSSELSIDEDNISSNLHINAPNATEYVLSISSSDQTNNELILNMIKEYSEKYVNYVASKNAAEQIKHAQAQKQDSLDNQISDKNRLLGYLNSELKDIDMFLGNNINPAYSSLLSYKTRLEFEKTELEFSKNDIEEVSIIANDFLSNNASFQDYLSTNQELLISDIMIEYGQIQTNEVYQFNAKTLFPIAGLLGIMLGIFIVFFKRYWISNSQANTSN